MPLIAYKKTKVSDVMHSANSIFLKTFLSARKMYLLEKDEISDPHIKVNTLNRY